MALSRNILYVLQTKNEIADFQNCDDSKLVRSNPCKNNTYFDLVVSLLFIYLIQLLLKPSRFDGNVTVCW